MTMATPAIIGDNVSSVQTFVSLRMSMWVITQPLVLELLS